MRKVFCLVIPAAFAVAGCVSETRVGGGYVLVTTSPGLLAPDISPGTSLHFQGERIWPSVLTGCFWPERATKFYHDGLFVFVGTVLGSDGYHDPLVYPQLYAVRANKPPVIISQRLFGQPLTNRYEVESIGLLPNGVRVRFEYSRQGRTLYGTNDVSWASAPVRTTARGEYRVLPIVQPPESD